MFLKSNLQLQEDSPLYHDALRISIKTPSFYCHDTFLVKEDDDVEFKGHLAFSYKQLPVKAKRMQTKRHISSVANGMLNNEKGGNILLGVHDDKCIEGFSLSRYQQQYIVLNIADTFNSSHQFLNIFMTSLSSKSSTEENQQIPS
jgi:hypothetical protein